jgi:hypothetical protein
VAGHPLHTWVMPTVIRTRLLITALTMTPSAGIAVMTPDLSSFTLYRHSVTNENARIRELDNGIPQSIAARGYVDTVSGDTHEPAGDFVLVLDNLGTPPQLNGAPAALPRLAWRSRQQQEAHAVHGRAVGALLSRTASTRGRTGCRPLTARPVQRSKCARAFRACGAAPTTLGKLGHLRRA